MSTWTQNSPVYLDYQATTLTDRRAGEIKRLGKAAAIAGAA
jgi:hypothetical protein